MCLHAKGGFRLDKERLCVSTPGFNSQPLNNSTNSLFMRNKLAKRLRKEAKQAFKDGTTASIQPYYAGLKKHYKSRRRNTANPKIRETKRQSRKSNNSFVLILGKTVQP
jgi:hypothetical protein